MTPLRRFATTVAPFFVLGACAQLIGLSDFDTGKVEPQGGAGGEGDASTGGTRATGGTGGTGVKTGGTGGDAGDGTAGVLSTGGRPGRGGTGGVSGAAGDPGGDTGGDTGQGGSTSTGGSVTGGTSQGGTSGSAGAVTGGTAGSTGGSGGSGGSPVCTEITLADFITGDADPTALTPFGIYAFEINPEVGSTITDTLQVEFWDDGIDFDGGQTGTFSFVSGSQDDNYVSCSRCLVLFQDEATTREVKYFQSGGSMTVFMNSTQMSGGAHFELTDLTLSEVVINDAGVSTPVAGGACLHLASGTFDMNGWNCNPGWYADADCDCGCGRLDPTCASPDETACRYCWCNVSSGCTPNEVEATSNWVCN